MGAVIIAMVAPFKASGVIYKTIAEQSTGGRAVKVSALPLVSVSDQRAVERTACAEAARVIVSLLFPVRAIIEGAGCCQRAVYVRSPFRLTLV